MRSIFATAAACKAISGASLAPFQECTIVELGQASLGVTNIGRADFIFDPNSSASDALEQMVLTPTAGTGRWLRYQKSFDLKAAIGFALADNATLVTVPVGFLISTVRPFLEIVTQFAGGTNAAIGVSASVVPFSTAGDIIGGAGGELTAALTAGMRGKLGTALAAALAGTGQPFTLAAGGILKWNKIVDSFTSGAGFLHVPVTQLSL